MKSVTFAILSIISLSVNAQDSSADSDNPLGDLLATASSNLAVAETSYSTRNEVYESLYTAASEQIADITESYGTGTLAETIYSSIAADYNSAFGDDTPDYNEVTVTGSELSSVLASGESALSTLETEASSDIAVITSEASASVPVGTYSGNLANQAQAGALGVIGAAVLGVAAFL